MALFVGKDRIGKGCNEGCFAVVAPMPEAKEGWEEAGDDEDGQKDDEGGREGRGRHADVALQEVQCFRNWVIICKKMFKYFARLMRISRHLIKLSACIWSISLGPNWPADLNKDQF